MDAAVDDACGSSHCIHTTKTTTPMKKLRRSLSWLVHSSNSSDTYPHDHHHYQDAKKLPATATRSSSSTSEIRSWTEEQERDWERRLDMARSYIRQQLDRSTTEHFYKLLEFLLPTDPFVAYAAVEADVLAVSDLPRCYQSDREFMLQLAARYTELWQYDWESPNSAVLSCCINDFSNLPIDLQNDRAFLLQVVKHRPEAWLLLPTEFLQDIELAYAIPEFNYPLAHAVLEEHPTLCGNADIWMKIIASDMADQDGLGLLLVEMATDTIKADRNVMTAAYKHDSETRQFVSDELWMDRQFTQMVLETEHIGALHDISTAAQCAFPDLIATVLELSGTLYSWDKEEDDNVIGLADCIAPQLWYDHRIVTAWCHAGHPFLPQYFPDHWKSDPEIFLCLAKKGRDPAASFQYVSIALLSDKDFLLQVVSLQPSLFYHLPLALSAGDTFAVAVRALAFGKQHDGGNMTAFANNDDVELSADWQPYWRSIATDIGTQLAAHESFVALIASIQSGRLRSLDPGQQGRCLIASYLDVPSDQELRFLKAAWRNLPPGWKVDGCCGFSDNGSSKLECISGSCSNAASARRVTPNNTPVVTTMENNDHNNDYDEDDDHEYLHGLVNDWSDICGV